MKTTIEIADDLLERAKRLARNEHTSLRALVDEALRHRLGQSTASSSFKLRRHAFGGQGRQSMVAEGQWETVRNMIHRLG
jgi:Arc/MetJ family transcription regulator